MYLRITFDFQKELKKYQKGWKTDIHLIWQKTQQDKTLH